MISVADTLAELDSILSLTPAGFTWFGRPGPQPDARLTRRLSPGQRRDLLRDTLSGHLYRQLYCTGGPVESVPAPPGVPSEPFLEKLTAANAGQGCWRSGWRRVADRGEEIVAVRAGLQVRVAAQDWRPDPTAPERCPGTDVPAGEPVQLRGLKEARHRLPGFYVVDSDTPFEVDPRTDPLIRLYWNISAGDAAGLVRYVSTILNLNALPFGFKCGADPSSFWRCDAAVLYLRRQDWSRAVPHLTTVYRGVGERLARQVPAMTLPLAPGLGLAEDPGSGRSYGDHCCHLLAEGLLRAAELGIEHPSDRADRVVETFAEAGLDPQRPYRRPGSQQEHRLPPEAWPRSRRSAPGTARVGRRDRADRSPGSEPYPGSDPHPGTTRFRDVAACLTQDLVDTAIWHEDRCTWLGRVPDPAPEPPGQVLSARSSGPSVYSGTAGVALFLAEAGVRLADRSAADTALAAARHALAHADTLPAAGALGCYSGRLGVALAATRVGQLLESPRLLAHSRWVAHRAVAERPPDRERDVLGGDAGAIVALMDLAEQHDDEVLAQAAVDIAAEFHAAGYRQESALCWPSVVGEQWLTGFSHGAAGAVWALRHLAARTGDDRWEEAAQAARLFEDRWFDAARGNWADLRKPEHSGSFMTAWCHGAAGVALSRLVHQEPTSLSPARLEPQTQAAVRATRHQIIALLQQSDTDFSLCHGLSGLADIMLEVANRTGDSQARDVAVQVAGAGAALYAEPGRAWPTALGTGRSPSLMLGTAGIGLFYLRLIDPTLPTPLLPTGLAALPSSADGSRPHHPSPARASVSVPASASVPGSVSVSAPVPAALPVQPSGAGAWVRHVGSLDQAALTERVRRSLAGHRLLPDASASAAAELRRWNLGRQLRDRVLPSRLPEFADPVDYLAVADEDRQLWNSLPYMLAFGAEQSEVLQPLTGAGQTHRDESAVACAAFSALLSVFDYLVDETDQAAAVFAMEPDGLAEVFDNRAGSGLAAAYHAQGQSRVRLVATLFGVLAHSVRRLSVPTPGSRGTDRLERVMRRLFLAERSATLAEPASVSDLRMLSQASREKSVLPFLTLLLLAGLPVGHRRPAPEAAAAALAIGAAVCLADDLTDLIVDLRRQSPSPLVVSAVTRAGRGEVTDQAVLAAVDEGTAQLVLALRPAAFGPAGRTSGPPAAVAFARASVARWIGWPGPAQHTGDGADRAAGQGDQ